MKSKNGYFLLNPFNLRANKQWKLDDAILEALFNGE
jgi:hypothetical protein